MRVCFARMKQETIGVGQGPNFPAATREDAMQAISEVMTRDPAVIAPDADVQKAAQIMRDMNIGAIPVCDGKRLRG